MHTHRILLPATLALAITTLSACLNPYIKSPNPSHAINRPCGKTFDATQSQRAAAIGSKRLRDDGPSGIQYAECVRYAMETKAGNYAVMNNGGAAFLIMLAGAAAYQAFQGNNEANVAALTTGGAALYGVHSYVYKKPREAIYFVGAATISCAIGITRRRMSANPEELLVDLNRNVSLKKVRDALSDAQSYGAGGPNQHCPIAMRTRWREINQSITANAGPDAVAALDARKQIAIQRIERFKDIKTSAEQELVTATDRVRESVNHQLALMQPDPIEIGKSIGTLKLATLQGATRSSTTTTAETSAAVDRSADEADDFRAVAFGQMTGRCNIDDSRIDGFASRVRAFQQAYQENVAALTNFEARLTRLEGIDTKETDNLQTSCPTGRPPGLIPFAVVLAQQGPQRLKQGESLTIPIEGGVPPFTLTPAVAPKADTLTGTAKATEDGFAFVVTAAKTAPPSVYSMIATDGAGATRVVPIEVVPTAN